MDLNHLHHPVISQRQLGVLATKRAPDFSNLGLKYGFEVFFASPWSVAPQPWMTMESGTEPEAQPIHECTTVRSQDNTGCVQLAQLRGLES